MGSSPYVRVTINDQSLYASPTPSTIPLVAIATRSAKPRPDGSGIALGTLEANKLEIVDSQRTLVQLYGNPVFVTSAGAPVHGDETNETGLLAAHSALGLTNLAYVIRADIDLGQIVPNRVEPVLSPPDGTYWLNKTQAVLGVFRWSGSAWVRVQDVTSVNANSFTVFTTSPNNAVGIDGDWGWDYSSMDGTMLFKSGGTWLPASLANLRGAYGSGLNMFIQIAPPTGQATGDLWYKLTSSAAGVDAKVARFQAVSGQWIGQTIIRQATMPLPNQGTLWEDTSQILSSGKRPIYVGTGMTFMPLPLFVQATPPVSEPATGTFWYNDDYSDFALYVEGTGIGYGNQWVPVSTTTVSNPSSSQKVISASPPQFPAQGAIWIDLSRPEYIDNFPVIRKYVGTEWLDISASVLITDNDPGASLVSDGTYWVNLGESLTRNTVKQYDPTYTPVTVVNQAGTYVVVNQTGVHWKPAIGAKFGRKSQRAVVVRALQSAIVSNQQIRSELYYYQLITVPGYPELYDEMTALNADNNETALIINDTPKFTIPSGISEGREITLTEWVTNARNAEITGEDGFLGTPTPYAATYYPWGLGTDLDGNNVFVPPSHIALRTIAYSDSVSEPWFPPAGFTRGRVDNVNGVGYLDNDAVYTPLVMNRSMRDIAYQYNINPITQINRRGLVVFGQKTMAATASALDRVNVARLICKIKYDLDQILQPFLFELNDATTRRSAQIVCERYLSGLKALRALTNYGVRCDESNNTSDRIDANQMWVDIAIQPTRSIEFIYVPVTVQKTGDDVNSI